MIKKLILAVVVCLSSMTLADTTSQAGDCYSRGYSGYRGGISYRPSYGVSHYSYRASHGHHLHHRQYGRPVAVPVYPSVRSYGVYRGYSPYSSYRYGYGRSGFGYGYSPYSRGGVSISVGY